MFLIVKSIIFNQLSGNGFVLFLCSTSILLWFIFFLSFETSFVIDMSCLQNLLLPHACCLWLTPLISVVHFSDGLNLLGLFFGGKFEFVISDCNRCNILFIY